MSNDNSETDQGTTVRAELVLANRVLRNAFLQVALGVLCTAAATAFYLKPGGENWVVQATGPAELVDRSCLGPECPVSVSFDETGLPVASPASLLAESSIRYREVCIGGNERFNVRAHETRTWIGATGRTLLAHHMTVTTEEPSRFTSTTVDGRQCRQWSSPMILNDAERSFISDVSTKGRHATLEIDMSWEFEDNSSADSTVHSTIGLGQVAETRTLTVAETQELLAVEPDFSGRYRGVLLTLGFAACVLAIIFSVGKAASQPVLRLADRSQRFAELARENEKAAHANTERLELQRQDLHRILSTVHHEVGREIAMIGYVADDLAGEGADVSDLLDSHSRLELGRDTLAALSQLSSDAQVGMVASVSADSLEIPSMENAVLEFVNQEPLARADRTLLRLLVKHAAWDAIRYAAATLVRVTTTRDTLTIVDNGDWTTVDSTGEKRLSKSYELMVRIADAHGATIHRHRLPGGTIEVRLPNRPTDAEHPEVIDLRPKEDGAPSVTHSL